MTKPSKTQTQANPKTSSKKGAQAASKNAQANIESKLIDAPTANAGQSTPSIYRVENWDGMTLKQKRSFRTKRRKQLEKFVYDVLGKDRKDEERKTAKVAFMQHFKDHYISKDLTPSALYGGPQDSKRKLMQDFIDVLNTIK